DLTGRDLQPRRPIPRSSVVRDPRVYGQRRRTRRFTDTGGDSYPPLRTQDSFLSGIDLRNVRSGAGGPTEGNYAVLSTIALWRGQGLCASDHSQLSGSIWYACFKRNSVQS